MQPNYLELFRGNFIASRIFAAYNRLCLKDNFQFNFQFING